MSGVRGAGPGGGSLEVVSGTSWLLFAFDIGAGIDLELAATRLTDAKQRGRFSQRRRAPAWFQIRPEPLRVLQAGEALPIAGFRTHPTIECTLYDFGAVSVAYGIEVAGPLESLVALAGGGDEHDRVEADARARVARLVDALGDAIDRSGLSPLVEDYLIHRLAGLAPPLPIDALFSEHAGLAARVLRGEPESLSAEEIREALAARLSFTPEDAVAVDWNAALLIDPHGDGDDFRAVLEYANAQLLEVRLLDDQLDDALDRAYEVLARQPQWLARRTPRADLRALGRMQVDGALLHERVRNALKLLGDQYLARLYRAAAQRFHLPEWNENITRKLETIESIYQKAFDRNATRRLEILEWLIILLIAVGLVVPFVV